MNNKLWKNSLKNYQNCYTPDQYRYVHRQSIFHTDYMLLKYLAHGGNKWFDGILFFMALCSAFDES